MKNNIMAYKDAKWAHEKFCAGYSIDEIAESMNVCGRTIRRAFVRFGMRKAKPRLSEYKWGGSDETQSYAVKGL